LSEAPVVAIIQSLGIILGRVPLFSNRVNVRRDTDLVEFESLLKGVGVSKGLSMLDAEHEIVGQRFQEVGLVIESEVL
jgi:hypothetical protein